MDEVKVLVEAEINPTEADEKVKTAIANVFGSIPATILASDVGNILTAEAEGLNALACFRDLLRRDKVRTAARKVFFTRLREKTIVFFLNKQAAFANHVSFSQEIGESPLGPIRVTIKSQNPSELIDWLAPKTP
jgi:hypothetical protein